ncbi:MAG: efflux RND transporter periplasmic adaptor subunit [Acidobacteriota bacterium]
MRKITRLFVVLLILAGVTSGVYAWMKKRAHAAKGVTLVKVEKGSITEKAIAVGQIQPRQKIQVKSKISGNVAKCLVEVGNVVKAGDPLFEIAPDPTPLEITEVERQVETAQASATRAKAEYERAIELDRKGVTSKSDLDAKREAAELAEIGLAQAKERAELTRKGRVSRPGLSVESVIRAPAAGTILSRTVNPGDPVVPLTSYQPGTELATIADMGDLIFKGTVDEIDVGKLAMDLPARIKIGALPNDLLNGKVSRIAPQAQQKDGATLFDVEIELDPGKDLVLRAGYSANADLIIREKKDIVVVPERLVSMEDGGKKATVEVPGGAPDAPPKKIDVKLGLSDGLNVEVLEGVKEGDQIVERPPREIS